MLLTECSVVDYKGKRSVFKIKAVRQQPHPKLPDHYYYSYEAVIDDKKHLGNVLHRYENGAMALVAKITKHVVAQQKALRDKDEKTVR